MKCILLISEDQKLIDGLQQLQDQMYLPFEIYDGTNYPLDIMSTVCKKNPALIILDDDFVLSGTAHLLRSIRKVKPSLDIIFVTANNSIELGKKISTLVVQYYAIKPIPAKELFDSINSLLDHKTH
jgi:DNA-binding response OmpR family regulator